MGPSNHEWIPPSVQERPQHSSASSAYQVKWCAGDAGQFAKYAGDCYAAFLQGDDAGVDRLTEELQQEVCGNQARLQQLLKEAEQVRVSPLCKPERPQSKYEKHP